MGHVLRKICQDFISQIKILIGPAGVKGTESGAEWWRQWNKLSLNSHCPALVHCHQGWMQPCCCWVFQYFFQEKPEIRISRWNSLFKALFRGLARSGGCTLYPYAVGHMPAFLWAHLTNTWWASNFIFTQRSSPWRNALLLAAGPFHSFCVSMVR